MGKPRVIQLSVAQLIELKQEYRTSSNSTISRRCHIILLKSQPRTS